MLALLRVAIELYDIHGDDQADTENGL